jgi:hypothetical protein
MSNPISVLSIGILLAATNIGHAAILGFGQLGGSNTTVPAGYGSNAVADGNGLVVTNGITPGIALTWDANWDVHTAAFFAPLEDQTAGGGAWDNEGSVPRVGQLDLGTHTIGFSAAPGISLVLNSFDFAHTSETAGTTVWNLSLTDSASTAVWQQTVTFVNGSTQLIAPNFTGMAGQSYTLNFSRTSETYNSNGRHGIDNVNFTQIPEPSAALLAGMSVACLLLRRRK